VAIFAVAWSCLQVANFLERRKALSPISEELPSTHSGEYCPQKDYDSSYTRASKVKEKAMIERTNAPGLSQPPGYSHVVVASGSRLVITAGAVP